MHAIYVVFQSRGFYNVPRVLIADAWSFSGLSCYLRLTITLDLDLMLLSIQCQPKWISQFGVSKNTCARRDKKKHIFFFFCHAKYTHEFALKKIVFLRYAWFYPDARTCFLKLRTSLLCVIWTSSKPHFHNESKGKSTRLPGSPWISIKIAIGFESKKKSLCWKVEANY